MRRMANPSISAFCSCGKACSPMRFITATSTCILQAYATTISPAAPSSSARVKYFLYGLSEAGKLLAFMVSPHCTTDGGTHERAHRVVPFGQLELWEQCTAAPM